MSFDKVEVRVFSGPDQVQVGSNTEPDLIVMNIGPKGDAGTAATVTVGTTTTLAPGSSATVANAGTSSAAVFNFGIPTGATGATGAAGANGGSSTAWNYRAKTNATSGYPTNGHLLWNNAMQVNATEILVSHLNDEGSDIELFLSFFAENQKLFIQNRDDSSQNQIWEITGTPTVTNPNTSTAYYTFPVTLVSSQGAEFTNNHSILFGTITEATNSVTSATTSDGTANLSVLTLGVVPSGSITLASTNSGGFVQLSGQAATDARSIAFPNASGTLALTSQLPTLGTNVATFLATPTSANLASALTDESGTGGGFVRAEGASLTTPTLLGTPVFNATAYTYGAGAAAAHRTALGLKTIFAVSDESKTPNNTNYNDDSELFLTLEAGTWRVQVNAFWSNADNTVGVRAQVSFGGTMDTAKSPIIAFSGSSTDSNNIAMTSANSRPVGALTATMPRAVLVAATGRNGMLQTDHTVSVSVAGTYRLQWGQGTASPTLAAIRKAGSFIKATKLD